MPTIEFTQNHQDLSTDQGFQFKFFCERCGDGFMSTFETNPLGMAGSLLRGAGDLMGGLFGRAGESAYEIQRAVGGPQHDAALRRAVEEIRPLFNKCRRCGNWLCEATCWNGNAKMCKQCAPVAEEEETSARAAHAQAEISNDLAQEEAQRVAEKAKEASATCADCGTPTLGRRFCPGCGKKVAAAAAAAFCPSCGAKAAPGARFCGDCGAKLGG